MHRVIACLVRSSLRFQLKVNNLKRDPLEIQHPKFENSRLGFIESVHERLWQMRHRPLLCSQIKVLNTM